MLEKIFSKILIVAFGESDERMKYKSKIRTVKKRVLMVVIATVIVLIVCLATNHRLLSETDNNSEAIAKSSDDENEEPKASPLEPEYVRNVGDSSNENGTWILRYLSGEEVVLDSNFDFDLLLW